MCARIPDHARKYAKSPEFTTRNVPDKFTTSHSTKSGVWGKICVLEGALDYFITNSSAIESADAPSNAIRAEAGNHTIIEPEILHYVQLAENTRFFVEFYRIFDKSEQ